MDAQTKQFIIFPKFKPAKKSTTFFERAKKHIFKGGRKNRNLSLEIDKILYGKK